ncbi:uncharacterized protein LOC142575275 isoform X2 [Dermacentor variabilis]|uniref:uncharacterized protein LOC142575275 isoform X2 n=1 Tax=Dermacentor variabilis TaxID=34621 RepID=UPI003F5AFA68
MGCVESCDADEVDSRAAMSTYQPPPPPGSDQYVPPPPPSDQVDSYQAPVGTGYCPPPAPDTVDSAATYQPPTFYQPHGVGYTPGSTYVPPAHPGDSYQPPSEPAFYSGGSAGVTYTPPPAPGGDAYCPPSQPGYDAPQDCYVPPPPPED